MPRGWIQCDFCVITRQLMRRCVVCSKRVCKDCAVVSVKGLGRGKQSPTKCKGCEARMLDLEPIEAREKKATPGPWKWEDWGDIDPDVGPEEFSLTAPPETRERGPSEWFPDLRNRIVYDEPREATRADRDFIASARDDIPALIAEVKRLRAELRLARNDVMGI